MVLVAGITDVVVVVWPGVDARADGNTTTTKHGQIGVGKYTERLQMFTAACSNFLERR